MPALTDALATLRTIAGNVHENDPEARAQRFLERLAAREDCQELRGAIVQAGALAITDQERRRRAQGLIAPPEVADPPAAEPRLPMIPLSSGDAEPYD